jgi:hypothetical protein
MRREVAVRLLVTLSLVAGASLPYAQETGRQAPPGGAEFDHLIPDIQEACAIVREKPGAWPYRAFPYGPLGLEIRKAKSPAEATGVFYYETT